MGDNRQINVVNRSGSSHVVPNRDEKPQPELKGELVLRDKWEAPQSRWNEKREVRFFI
jgi:hypothetical protein